MHTTENPTAPHLTTIIHARDFSHWTGWPEQWTPGVLHYLIPHLGDVLIEADKRTGHTILGRIEDARSGAWQQEYLIASSRGGRVWHPCTRLGTIVPLGESLPTRGGKWAATSQLFADSAAVLKVARPTFGDLEPHGRFHVSPDPVAGWWTVELQNNVGTGPYFSRYAKVTISPEGEAVVMTHPAPANPRNLPGA